MVVYPSNSGKEPEKVVPTEQVEKKAPVVKGSAKIKQKGALTKFADIFLPEDRGSIKEYILQDVIVPYIKKIADDAFHMFLYGRGSTNSTKSQTSGTYYSSIFDGGLKTNRAENKVDSRHYIDEIIFDSRQDAELVLAKLREDVAKYKVVTVLALCEYADVPSIYTYEKYGWTDLSSASVVHVRDGYSLKLPKPFELDI